MKKTEHQQALEKFLRCCKAKRKARRILKRCDNAQRKAAVKMMELGSRAPQGETGEEANDGT